MDRGEGKVTETRKARKPGRPKLPKGEAKGKIVPVRFAPEDLKAITAAAKANKQSISEWIRNVTHEALQARDKTNRP